MVCLKLSEVIGQLELMIKDTKAYGSFQFSHMKLSQPCPRSSKIKTQLRSSLALNSLNISHHKLKTQESRQAADYKYCDIFYQFLKFHCHLQLIVDVQAEAFHVFVPCCELWRLCTSLLQRCRYSKHVHVQNMMSFSPAARNKYRYIDYPNTDLTAPFPELVNLSRKCESDPESDEVRSHHWLDALV